MMMLSMTKIGLFAFFCTSAVSAAVRDVLETVALQGGAEFDDPSSYQSKALQFVEIFHSNDSNFEMIQYYALACIYHASHKQPNKRTITGLPQYPVDDLPGWITSTNWLTVNDKCSWYGISCIGSGVSAIELHNNRMLGIFAPEVQLLASTLKVIDLFANTFLVTEGDAGNAWIGELTNLENLFFGSTSFEYPGVPSFIGNLKRLVEIDISNTFYTMGPIRVEAFTDMPNLEYVDIGDNVYTSTIPSGITQLIDLQFLYIDYVTFLNVEQSLDFLVGMPSLFENWMDYTYFGSTIPTEIGEISTLKSFSCTFCGLKGTIPTELGNLDQMDRMWLYQNELEGTIPTELGDMNRIKYLHLEGNNLNGNMPNEVCLNISPFALLTSLGADCSETPCECCTCCNGEECNNFAAGTPNPTSAPTGGAPVQVVSVPGGLCFSGESLVDTVQHGAIPLKEARVGDLVRNGGIVEPIYTFGHYDKDRVVQYIQIHAAGLPKPLELSPDHLLFTNRDVLPASSVVVGDRVLTAEGTLAEVQKIGSTVAKGVFAPFTKSGTIAVDGIIASNYITFQPNSASLRIAGIPIINMHWVSHVFMAPYRLWRSVSQQEETFINGVNSWMIGPLNILRDLLLRRGALVQTLVFLPLFAIAGAVYALETNLALCLLGAASAVWYARQTRKKAT